MTSSSGQYLILKKIAVGGMAEIFLARRVSLGGFGKFVVVKKLAPEFRGKAAFETLFIGEAKLSARLAHGNTIQLYDLGQEDDAYFMVMEYVHGVSSAELMARVAHLRAPVPPSVALQIIYRTALALSYCESVSTEEGEPLQILHHDVSPHNIQIRFDGIVKLLDFGVATQLSDPPGRGRRGKFAYMSPEALRREQLDHRSDQFSLGVVFFELLTGRRLFKGRTPAETQQKAELCVVPRLRSIRSDIPALLEDLVLKMLSKDREQRFESFSKLAERIERSARMLSYPLEARMLSAFLQQTYGEELSRRIDELSRLCEHAQTRGEALLEQLEQQERRAPRLLFSLDEEFTESTIPLAGERGEEGAEWAERDEVSEVSGVDERSKRKLSSNSGGQPSSARHLAGKAPSASGAPSEREEEAPPAKQTGRLMLVFGLLVGLLLGLAPRLLSPPGAAEHQAHVTIRSAPSEVEVYADGVLLGLTPLVDFRVDTASDSLLIELKNEGYETVSERFSLLRSRRLELVSHLKPERAPEPEPERAPEPEPERAPERAPE